MSTKEPDWSQFQSIDHINASIALGGLISELEEKAGAGLPWISDPKGREHMEQEQKALLQHAREFAEIWEERRKECGRVPAFPGAFYARQAPQFDDFTQRAIMLLRDYETCHTLEMQFTCDMITGLLEKEREAFCNLNKQVEILRAKAGESEALRGQARALEKVCKELEKRIQENQTITEMFRELLTRNSETRNYLAQKIDKVQETVEDQHRHAGEKWATIPKCVRAVLSAVELEENDGKDMPRPPKYDALRIAVQRRLASKGKRARKGTKGTFYPIDDIAEAMAEEYRGFSKVQYIREFEPVGCLEDDLPRVHKA